MGAFHQSLPTLLRWRASLEKQQEMLLAQAAHQLAAAETSLEAERLRRRTERGQLLEALESGLPAEALHVAGWSWEAAWQRDRERQAEVERLREARQLHCADLQQKTSDRKVVESLHTQHRLRRQKEQARRDQQAVDDAFARRQTRTAAPK